MTTTPRTARAPRALFPLAMAGALSALAVTPMAAYADTGGPAAATAAYTGGGVGYNKVIDGRAAGTVKLTVEGRDVVEAFCIQYAVPVAESGAYTAKTYAGSGVANVAKAADIAVRHNSIAGQLNDPRAENTAAQLAIWSLTDGKDFSKVPNASIVARATTLAAAAQARAEAPSSFVVSGTATVTGEGDTATDTVVASVTTEEGTPVAGQQVTFTVGSDVRTGTTDASGQATVTVDAPDDAAEMQLRTEATVAAGTVLAPAGAQAMVTTSTATVTRSGVVALPGEPAPKPKPTPTPTPETKAPETPTETETPAPAPEDPAPTTEAPKGEDKPAEKPKPADKKVDEPKPHVLPRTGGWATIGMFVAAVTAAGAGFAGRKLARRR